MMNNNHVSKKIEINQEKSHLEKIKLHFEHTDDSRVLIHRQKQLKHPTQTTAARR